MARGKNPPGLRRRYRSPKRSKLYSVSRYSATLTGNALLIKGLSRTNPGAPYRLWSAKAAFAIASKSKQAHGSQLRSVSLLIPNTWTPFNAGVVDSISNGDTLGVEGFSSPPMTIFAVGIFGGSILDA